jgi:hypothetical protein
MAEGRMVVFELRNGEKRAYEGVTHVDDSRRHLVLVHHHDDVIAQLNKHDVVKFSFQVSQAVAEEASEDAEEGSEATSA